jgi:glutamate-1-semialdehyde 2,1-aminomutase
MQAGEVFPQIERVGNLIMNGLSEILSRYGVAHIINGVPAMLGICLSEKRPRDWRDLLEADWEMLSTITTYMVENGVMPEADGMEPYFLCSAHSDEDAAETLQVFEDGLRFALGKG